MSSLYIIYTCMSKSAIILYYNNIYGGEVVIMLSKVGRCICLQVKIAVTFELYLILSLLYACTCMYMKILAFLEFEHKTMFIMYIYSHKVLRISHACKVYTFLPSSQPPRTVTRPYRSRHGRHGHGFALLRMLICMTRL